VIILDLFVLRHGEAGKGLAAGAKDAERPLTVTGQKEIAEIGKSIKDLGIKFDFILSSPLKRAHQTAAIVAKIMKGEKKMQDWNELKPEGNKMELYKKLSQLKQESSVLVVGHEPYLSTMIGEIISSGNVQINLKKGGLARIRVVSFSPKVRGELRWLLTPKQMKIMCK
jgi:phosphohistidine phosphatase